MAEDSNEIWSTFSSWTKSYVEYLVRAARKHTDTLPKDAFLRMQAIGPLNIDGAGKHVQMHRNFSCYLYYGKPDYNLVMIEM